MTPNPRPTGEALDALRRACEQYRTAELTESQAALASMALAEAEQLARIADGITDLIGVARLALTGPGEQASEPACRVDVSTQEVGAPCSSCGHTGYAHRPMNAGPDCVMCLALGRPPTEVQDDPPPDVDVFRPASFVPQPDPAGEWLRDNAAQVIAALRAHADVFEDEASRGMYGGAEGEERAYALAQGQRARAIAVRQVTSEPRL